MCVLIGCIRPGESRYTQECTHTYPCKVLGNVAQWYLGFENLPRKKSCYYEVSWFTRFFKKTQYLSDLTVLRGRINTPKNIIENLLQMSNTYVLKPGRFYTSATL